MKEELQDFLDKAELVLMEDETFKHDDYTLKKVLVFDFFTSLLEDEILQAEYHKADIALIVLMFWNNNESEKRIKNVLYEPIENHYFIHFSKHVFERSICYEFILKGIILALQNNFILKEALRDLLEEARKASTNWNNLPVEHQNKIGISCVLRLVNPEKDPAIQKVNLIMN